MVRKHNACSNETSFSNNDTVVGGGTLGSPEKLNYTISLKTFVSPVAEILSEEFKSDIISYLNFWYNGLVFFNLPPWNCTVYHHVMVEGPKKSGSMDELILSTNSVMNRGCSSRLLKNLNTDFYVLI
jgi:hypothetical protein